MQDDGLNLTGLVLPESPRLHECVQTDLVTMKFSFQPSASALPSVSWVNPACLRLNKIAIKMSHRNNPSDPRSKTVKHNFVYNVSDQLLFFFRNHRI